MSALGQKLFLQAMNPIAHASSVCFQFCFARAAPANAACQTRECRILPDHEPGKNVFQLRQLNLNLTFVRLSTLGKNVQNQLRTIDDFQIGGLGDRAHLRRLQLAIKDDHIRAELHGAN